MKTTDFKKYVLACGVSAAATLVFAAPTTNSMTTSMAPSALTPQQFVSDAAVGNMKEVAFGREALARSQNADVKRFASTMIRDHTICNRQLEVIAQQEGLTWPATNTFGMDDPVWNSPLLKSDQTIKGQPAEALISTNLPYLSEYQSLQHLRSLSGPAFDQAYVSDMVSDHAQDIAEFESASRTLIDARLKQFASSTLPTLRSHYRMAQDLAGKLAATTPATPVKTGAMQSAAIPGM